MSELGILNYSRRWDNPEDFPSFAYTKDWNSADDFPTIETDEIQVRADMQCLYDEVRDYLNGALRSFLVGIGTPGSVREAENPAVRVTLDLPAGWAADPAGGWKQEISIAGVTGNTRVDLRAGLDARAALGAAGVTALWVENRAGTLTARSLGAAPGAVTVQAELYETQPAAGVLNGTIFGDCLGLGGGSGGGGGGGGSAVNPVAKTAAMTQPVGVDANGRLWTAPLDAVDVSVVGQ